MRASTDRPATGRNFYRGALGSRQWTVRTQCTLRKGLDHFLLMFGRLRHDVVVFHLRGGQVQLVGGLDVRHFFEQVHQLWQIKELAESRSCPVAGAFGEQFVKTIS